MNSKILVCMVLVSLVSLVFFGCLQSGPKDCKGDLACLQKEAANCNPATLTYVQSSDSAGYGITSTTYFEIKGKVDGKCTLYAKFEDISVEYPPEVTAEEKMQAEAIFGMFEGLDGTCTFPSNEALTAVLNSISNEGTTVDWSDAECTGKLFEIGGVA